MPRRSKQSGSKPQAQVRHEVSAGGLIWRRAADGTIEVVLVRPAGRATWVLPKGHIEAGEGVLEAALREATEESGLKVSDGEKLGEVSYVYSWRDQPNGQLTRIFKRVHFYLMEAAGGDTSRHDAEIDEVVWVRLDEALKRVSHKTERELIAKAKEMLERTGC